MAVRPCPSRSKQLLVNVTSDEVAATLKDSFLEDPVETSINGFLVNTGTTFDIDRHRRRAIAGTRHGRLLGNLRAAGYKPEQVDEVYLTHMHGDHVGGLVIDGTQAYPNAYSPGSSARSGIFG